MRREGAIRRSTGTGRPAGAASFIARIEARLGRGVTAGKRGRKTRQRAEGK
jgi:hypothetical protein